MTNEKFQGVVPCDKWPETIRGRTEVAGLFVGGCVDRGVGSSFRATAHAHTSGSNVGWICVRGWRRIYQKLIMLHELAHIITGHGHTDKWRACLRALGGKVAAHNQKRKRKPCRCGQHKFSTPAATWYVNDNAFHSWAICRSAPPTTEEG